MNSTADAERVWPGINDGCRELNFGITLDTISESAVRFYEPNRAWYFTLLATTDHLSSRVMVYLVQALPVHVFDDGLTRLAAAGESMQMPTWGLVLDPQYQARFETALRISQEISAARCGPVMALVTDSLQSPGEFTPISPHAWCAVEKFTAMRGEALISDLLRALLS